MSILETYRYTPIDTESTRNTFLDYIGAINLGPIDYFAAGVENTNEKKLTSISSLPDWQAHLHKRQLAKNDPVIIAKLRAQRNLIPYSEIDHVDSLGAEIMRQRKLFGISDGLLLIHKKEHLKYMVMLATGFSKFDYYSFLKKYYSKLSRLKHDLTKIIERDIDHFFR